MPHTHPFQQEAPAEQSFHLPSFLAALAAALVGAVVWAMIAWMTGYEVGYVAWGIGALVGFAVIKFGGRGKSTAGMAAAMTLVAIFAGKLAGTHFMVEKELEGVREVYFTSELYNELNRDAAAFGELGAPTDEDLRAFMVLYDYGGFTSEGEISDGDLAYFRQYSIPALERIINDHPTFTEWQDQSYADYRTEFEREFTLTSAVVDELNGIDVIFAVLAVTTAFSIISRAGRELEPAETAATEDEEFRQAA